VIKIALIKFQEEKMKKYIFAAIGALAIVVGGIDWAVGALVPHSRILMITGAIAIAVAGFLHRWQKLQKPQWPLLMTLVLAIFGAVDTCVAGVHDVLIRPEVTPIQQCNSHAVSGQGAWVIVLVIVVVGLTCLLVQKFFRGRSDQPQGQE